MQWCALPTSAIPPPGRSSWIHISHSGRSRAKRHREHAVDQRVEVLAGLRRVQVAGRVEPLVVDPHRLVHAERHPEQPLPPAGRAFHAPGDQVEQSGGGRAAAVLGRIEQRHPADVHRRPRALDREEGRVQCGQALGAQGPGTSRIMIRFVPPAAPMRPAVMTTSAPGGSPAKSRAPMQRGVDQLVDRVGDRHRRGVDAPLQRELLGDAGLVGERQQRPPRPVLRARARRAAGGRRHDERGGVDLVGELDGGVHDGGGRGVLVDLARAAVDLRRLLGGQRDLGHRAHGLDRVAPDARLGRAASPPRSRRSPRWRRRPPRRASARAPGSSTRASASR